MEEIPDSCDLVAVESRSSIDELNKAAEGDLTAIKGIGPKTAKKILECVPVESFNDLDLPAHIVTKLEAHFVGGSALQQE